MHRQQNHHDDALASASANAADLHPMVALSDHLRDLSAASPGLPGEWHNTVMSLRDAADFLIEAAEMIVRRGEEGGGLDRFPTPERAIECALACVHRVRDGGKVIPVSALGWDV